MNQRLTAALLGLLLIGSPALARQNATDLIRPKTEASWEARAKTETWLALEQIARDQSLAPEVEVVIEHLQEMLGRHRPSGRLSCVIDSLANPWVAPAHADRLRADLTTGLDGKRPTFEGLVGRIASWLDLSESVAAQSESLARLDATWEKIVDPKIDGLELLQALSDYVGLAHDALAANLSALTEPDRNELMSGAAPAAEAWFQTHFPELPEEESDRHTETLKRFRQAVLQVDRAPILAVAERLVRLIEPDLAYDLGKRLAKAKAKGELEGFSGDIQAIVGDRPANRVVLGGRRPARYGAAALIIDLGGNDEYQDSAVADSQEQLVSIVLDLRGKDHYAGTRGPVFTVGGVALLLDLDQDDTYVSKRHAQGAAVTGFSLLADVEGNDRYECEDYGQGYSYAGVGLLIDTGGDDDYRAWAYAQGAGIGNGLAALVDTDGDDQYLADEHWPDVYGDSGPNIFHGASQGYSTGLRGGASEIAGGLAALIDLGSGRDRYQSGNFSQGGGYYFGFGLMYDGGGDDLNYGTRYSQGFGVHQAVGIRQDAGGNDEYHTRSVAHCGSAWDEAVGYFIEEGGDDLYDAGGLALGAAAQTAVAVMLDASGNDEYRSQNGATQGAAGSSEYHDKPSIAWLLDAGGGRDTYSREDRGNDRIVASKWNAVFIDTQDRAPVDGK